MRVFSRFVIPSELRVSELRAEFPVLRRLAYLNAGTDGPLPAAAVRAAAEELRREAEDGRAAAHFERRGELGGQLSELQAERSRPWHRLADHPATSSRLTHRTLFRHKLKVRFAPTAPASTRSADRKTGLFK